MDESAVDASAASAANASSIPVVDEEKKAGFEGFADIIMKSKPPICLQHGHGACEVYREGAETETWTNEFYSQPRS